MSDVFHTRVRNGQKMRKIATRFCQAHSTEFATPADALQFLNYIFIPLDGSWAFKPSGKTGTTSTLYFLFHLMFGYPLSAQLAKADGMNENDAGHALAEAGVFSFLLSRGDGRKPVDLLDAALRLTTVRNPLSRAISGFSYLCKSNRIGSETFFRERVRMTALTGFDWNNHSMTAEGFERFLAYLEMELPHHRQYPVNSHFRPQVLNIRPVIFRPDLIGRCEDLPAFFTEISTRLDRPLPDGIDLSTQRNQLNTPEREMLDTAATRRLVARVFAEDFETFGYDL